MLKIKYVEEKHDTYINTLNINKISIVHPPGRAAERSPAAWRGHAVPAPAGNMTVEGVIARAAG